MNHNMRLSLFHFFVPRQCTTRQVIMETVVYRMDFWRRNFVVYFGKERKNRVFAFLLQKNAAKSVQNDNLFKLMSGMTKQ